MLTSLSICCILDSRLEGTKFESHYYHSVVSLSKTYPHTLLGLQSHNCVVVNMSAQLGPWFNSWSPNDQFFYANFFFQFFSIISFPALCFTLYLI